VTFGDVAVGQGLLDGRLEVEKSQRVCYRRSGSADARRYLLLRQSELVRQLAIGVSLLDGVEVGALHVLDQRDGQLVALGQLTDDRWDMVQAGYLGGPDAALAGHELVSIEDLGHQHGLQNAMNGDACGE
jgi:hypothetical protein